MLQPCENEYSVDLRAFSRRFLDKALVPENACFNHKRASVWTRTESN